MVRPAAGELRIDSTRCDGHGICVLTCPELLALDQWGYATVRSGKLDSPKAMRRARRAVARCPARALFIELAQ